MRGDAAALLVILGMTVYFLPFVIAGGRRHHATWAIFALDLFLGWSLVGWAVALSWSLTPVRRDPTPPPAPTGRVVCPDCGREFRPGPPVR